MNKLSVRYLVPEDPDAVSLFESLTELQEAIRQRAFGLFEERGTTHGNEMRRLVARRARVGLGASRRKPWKTTSSSACGSLCPESRRQDLQITAMPDAIVVETEAVSKEAKETKDAAAGPVQRARETVSPVRFWGTHRPRPDGGVTDQGHSRNCREQGRTGKAGQGCHTGCLTQPNRSTRSAVGFDHVKALVGRCLGGIMIAIKKVLVPTDFGEYSQFALKYAAAFAEAFCGQGLRSARSRTLSTRCGVRRHGL